jgi:hypothetical protein
VAQIQAEQLKAMEHRSLQICAMPPRRRLMELKRFIAAREEFIKLLEQGMPYASSEDEMRVLRQGWNILAKVGVRESSG